MSKINKKKRAFQIKKKQKRKEKIKKLKEKYFLSKTKGEKEKILEKIKRVAPHYPLEEFLK